MRFNPFFIRASVYCAPKNRTMRKPAATFQSLLHQGISLLQRKAATARERIV